MNKCIKLIISALATTGYFLVLRYVAPSHEPYFILGIGLIGYIAWSYGIIAGLSTALLLIPTTLYIYSKFEISTSYVGFSSSPPYIALEVLTAVTLGRFRKKNILLSKRETALAEANEKLKSALAGVREFGGIHSLCTLCKNILGDDGSWQKIDAYLKEKTKAEFSHGICPDCAEEHVAQHMQPTP